MRSDTLNTIITGNSYHSFILTTVNDGMMRVPDFKSVGCQFIFIGKRMIDKHVSNQYLFKIHRMAFLQGSGLIRFYKKIQDSLYQILYNPQELHYSFNGITSEDYRLYISELSQLFQSLFGIECPEIKQMISETDDSFKHILDLCVQIGIQRDDFRDTFGTEYYDYPRGIRRYAISLPVLDLDNLTDILQDRANSNH